MHERKRMAAVRKQEYNCEAVSTQLEVKMELKHQMNQNTATRKHILRKTPDKETPFKGQIDVIAVISEKTNL